MTKKIRWLWGLCAVVLLVSGCGSMFNDIYDDDSKIARASDSFAALTSFSRGDGRVFTMSASAMSGTQTIWQGDADSGQALVVDYSLSMEEGGKVKLVLISPSGQVTVLAECTEPGAAVEGQLGETLTESGKYRIKVVGRDGPKYTLRLEFDPD